MWCCGSCGGGSCGCCCRCRRLTPCGCICGATDGSKAPFWVHDQGADKKIRKKIGGNVGAISSANPLSDVERLVQRSASTPGPQDYNSGGMAEEMLRRNNGKLSTAYVRSDLERQIDLAKQKPGPTDYRVKDIRRRVKGTKFSTSIEPRDVERIMREASLLPGPVDYQPY